MNEILSINPILLAFGATLFTWACTAFGASAVFLFPSIPRKVFNGMLGFAAGIMISASFWSLLLPGLEMGRLDLSEGAVSWLPVTIGFFLGASFLYFLHKLLPHLHIGIESNKQEGRNSSWKRSVLLVTAITIHNLPEGLAVGVGFGVISGSADPASAFLAAVALSFGIGIQNIPEGAAVSVPLRREGFSRGKAFFYGQMSGIVEPIGGILGAGLVLSISSILPYALGFAAGAMVFVVIEELIPESHTGNETEMSTLGSILGFLTMMILDLGSGDLIEISKK
jgi:ZIP family zinc transporter